MSGENKPLAAANEATRFPTKPDASRRSILGRYPPNIREEELKNKVAAEWFPNFDTTQIVGNVDFCVAVPATPLGICEAESVLWAEAKRGAEAPLDFALVQLILTIGKERTFDRHLPPKYLAAFNAAVTDRLNVLLMNDHYRQSGGTNALGFQLFSEISFSDGQKAHRIFWNRYKRPPRKEYWNYIVNRRDLLVPQDVRERKGSFFTPQQWVSLSQDYLASVLGENWQDDHYVWDCCCGTGNLEVGLTNKYNVWVSTLDQQDVDVIHQRIKLGANLLDSHVFQFDFLNDPFDKLPQGLKEIIDDPEKRRRLVIYINPPYAEAGDIRQRSGTGQNKTDVSVVHATYNRYLEKIGIAGRELFAQFFMRIHDEIPGCVLAEFSKLKHLQSPNFKAFRQAFHGRLEKCFIVPADTFDNVKGDFPIGFFVWRLGNIASAGVFTSTVADVYDRKGEFIGTKTILSYDNERSINDWLIETRKRPSRLKLGFLSTRAHDVQDINTIYIKRDKALIKSARGSWITNANLTEAMVYLAVCHGIVVDWLNDRDQFLYPNNRWETDTEFQTDCLVYALFHGQNRISSRDGVNHWIPFTEEEVGARDCFKSHFMSDVLNGRAVSMKPPQAGTAASSMPPYQGELFADARDARPCHEDESVGSRVPRDRNSASLRPCVKENLSTAARAVLDAGRELWRYYHAQPNANPDASYYDIRLHFQGTTTDAKGKVKMNPDSADATYTSLLANLRAAMKNLAKRIEPKVYEYGFLKG